MPCHAELSSPTWPILRALEPGQGVPGSGRGREEEEPRFGLRKRSVSLRRSTSPETARKCCRTSAMRSIHRTCLGASQATGQGTSGASHATSQGTTGALVLLSWELPSTGGFRIGSHCKLFSSSYALIVSGCGLPCGAALTCSLLVSNLFFLLSF